MAYDNALEAMDAALSAAQRLQPPKSTTVYQDRSGRYDYYYTQEPLPGDIERALCVFYAGGKIEPLKGRRETG